MKRRTYLFLAASSAAIVALAALPAMTARRPRYGGTLVVEIGAGVKSADPGATAADVEEASAKAQIDALVYDHRNADGTFAEPGPFRVAEWEPGKHAVVAANEDYKGGRPFVDTIEIQMSRSPKDRVIDIELGKADVAEIPVDQARRAAERGARVSRSRPDELIALVFKPGRPAARDVRIREAVARAIDRPAIVTFILQKEGEAAGGLLPQWSSGTAFLFPTAHDANDTLRAKELWSQNGSAAKIVLGYDSSDALGQAIAERIVVNAREAGIPMTAQAATKTSQGRLAVDAQLVRLSMPSPEPRAALAGFLDVLSPMAGLDPGDDALPEDARPEQIYEREAAVVRSFSIVPIARVPQVYGLSGRVRDWKAPGPGESLPLADVWLDQTDAQPEKGSP